MLSSLHAEISSRITAAQRFAQHACSQATGHDGLPSQVARGMVWVQLYAIWEFTVIGSVREAIAESRVHNHKVNSLKPAVLAIVLDNKIKSAVDAREGTRTQWHNRISLFLAAHCDDVAKWDDTIFPTDGSHYRPAQLDTIWAIFGVSQPIVSEPRHRGLIENMVDFRNAIAHGRETPESIGKRFTADDIMARIAAANELCLYVSDTLVNHCRTPSNLCR